MSDSLHVEHNKKYVGPKDPSPTYYTRTKHTNYRYLYESPTSFDE